MKRLSFLLLFACGASFAQGVSHTNIALYNSGGFARVVPSAVITVCTANDPQTPCTTKISIYTNYQLTSALANPFNADANGNYTFYAASGNYTVTVTGIGVTGYSYQISLLGGAWVSTPNVFTVPQTFNGGLVATSGQNIFNTYNINNILFVDGNKYTTLAAALAACPATGCEIVDTLPETFTVDPFTGITAPYQVWLLPGAASSTWTTNVPIRMAARNGQNVIGAGPNLTQIVASGTFPINSSVISVGAPGPSGVNGSGVFQLAVNCSSIAGCTGINLDGVQELSGTMNTQVVNAMVDGFSVNSNQGAGASQNQMVLDHIRAQCSVSAPASCVPVHVTSTAGARVVIRDVTAVTVTPTVTTDCIKSDSANATVILEDAHVEECTNGFHHTSAGGQFEVDGITGSTTTTTLVRNDSSSASYQLRNLTLNSSTNTLIDAGRSITTSAPFCSAAGTALVFVLCGDAAVPWQIANGLITTPPIGAVAGIKQQLLAGFTGATPALVVFDNGANTQLNFTNDGRIQLRGNQTGAFVQTMASDTLTAGRAIQFPNGPSATTLVAALVTTAAATDNVTIQGMTASGHCSLTPTNAAAIGAATPPGVTTKTANQITVTHAVTANMNYDVMCTSN